jgi:predicted nucleic acid-binding protein
MKRVMLDTNVYIDWIRAGEHEPWVVGGELVRHMSSVVLMELEAGARTAAAQRAVGLLGTTFARVGRLEQPTRAVWQRAGTILRKLRNSGLEVRRAALVHDVLIALTARAIGATLLTRDESDHTAIRKLVGHSFSAIA